MIRSAVLVKDGAASGSINERFEVAYTRTYVVEADFSDDEVFVRSNFGAAVVPPVRLFGGHPSDAFARCKGFTADHITKMSSADGTVYRSQWRCTATWGYMNPFEVSESGDPTECPVEVVIEGVMEQREADVDVNGNPVATSAGVPFNPPVMMDRQKRAVKLSRYEKGLTLAALFGDEAVVNAAPWQGLPAGTFKMGPPRVTPRYTMGLNITCYRVERVFEYNPIGWNAKPLDAGFHSLDTSSNKLVTLLDRDGLPLTEAALLDGSGQPLALPPNSGDIYIHDFKIYKDADFDAFGFPANILSDVGF